MIKINGQATSMSQIKQQIKVNKGLKWEAAYVFYLVKMNSGNVSFETIEALVAELRRRLDDEPTGDEKARAKKRGDGPKAMSALTLEPVSHERVHKDDRASLLTLMTTGKPDDKHCVSRGAHKTDPETGFPCGTGVKVTEYSLGGAEGRRATKRTEGALITYYYSASHAFATYKYTPLF